MAHLCVLVGSAFRSSREGGENSYILQILRVDK